MVFPPASKPVPTALMAGCAVVVSLVTWMTSEAVDPVRAVAGLFFAFVLVLTLHKYKYGVLMTILLLPLSASRVVPREMLGLTGLNPFNLVLLTTLFLVLITRVLQPRKLHLPAVSLPACLYLLCLFLGAANGLLHAGTIPAYFRSLQVISFDSPLGYVLEMLVKPVLILLAAYLVAIAVANARQPKALLASLFLSATVLPLLLITQVLLTRTTLSSMVSGGESLSGVHVNELGLMFNMAFALALFCFFSRGAGARRWWLGLVLAVLAAGILLTFSRGAYLGLVTVLIFFLYRKKRLDLMLLGLLVLPLAVLFLPEAVMQRAATGLGNGDVDTISAGRVNDIWRPLLPEFAASPLIGQGISSVLWSEPARTSNFFMAGRVGHPHSAYLGMLLDFGLLGTLVICLFFSHMWRSFILLARRHPDALWRDFFSGAAACLLVLLVQGVTDDRATPTVAQSNLWLAYGIALGMLGRRATTASAGPGGGSVPATAVAPAPTMPSCFAHPPSMPAAPKVPSPEKAAR